MRADDLIETNETPEQKKAFVEWFGRQQADYCWCVMDIDILARYPGQVVLLHERKILGSGADHAEALASARASLAEQGKPLPPMNDLLFVPIPVNPWLEEWQLPPATRASATK